MKPFIILAAAEEELEEAFLFYDARSKTLGKYFMSGIKLALARIRSNPSAWPVVRRRIRRKIVPRFPYALIFRNDPDRIVVIAVMHLHRRPGYWSDRL
jgi:plasmid stabilization system protein ParE